jgi:hypothetical protein
MKSKNKTFTAATFGIFIILFLLNISIGLEEDKGVTLEKVTNTVKSNCVDNMAEGCEAENWVSCNHYEGVGNKAITACGDCSAVQNAESGSPDLCCAEPVKN